MEDDYVKRVIIMFSVLVISLFSYEINAGSKKGSVGYMHPDNRLTGSAFYYPATRLNEVLFVEDPGYSEFGPATKPDAGWQGILNNIIGPGNYGWFGATTDPNQDGPDLPTMQQYPIVIWNTYDYWWGYGQGCPAALTPNDETNIADYINNGGKLWLIGQDIIYSGVPASWLNTNFHLFSVVEDYTAEDSTLSIEGVAQLSGYSLMTNCDYQINKFWCDALTPDTQAHHVVFDATYSQYNSIASPNTTPLHTSFWTVDGRNPNPAGDWENMVHALLEAFGWTGIFENPIVQNIAPFGFSPSTPDLTKGKILISYTTFRSGKVVLGAYDESGRLVRILISRVEKPGLKTIYWDCRSLSPGVYFLRLKAKEGIASRKLIIVK